MTDSSDTRPLRERMYAARQANDRMNTVCYDLSDVKTSIEKVNEKVRALMQDMQGTATNDQIIDIKAALSQIHERVALCEMNMSQYVTKAHFKEQLDEISACFEEYVLTSSGTTPRININEFERRISVIEQKLEQSQREAGPKLVIEGVDLPGFRKPQPKQRPSA